MDLIYIEEGGKGDGCGQKESKREDEGKRERETKESL
jgi:hypothetical protein